jgi:diacylglycerol kinase
MKTDLHPEATKCHHCGGGITQDFGCGAQVILVIVIIIIGFLSVWLVGTL